MSIYIQTQKYKKKGYLTNLNLCIRVRVILSIFADVFK